MKKMYLRQRLSHIGVMCNEMISDAVQVSVVSSLDLEIVVAEIFFTIEEEVRWKDAKDEARQ